MADEDMHDQPIPQRLKVISFLDLTPGYEGTYGSGDKILILTVGHAGEVDHPMCVSLRDGWKMAHHLIAALTFHGHEKAKAMLPLFSDKPYDGDDAAAEHLVMTQCEPVCERTGQTVGQAKSNPQPWVTSVETTGLTMTVRMPDPSTTPMTLDVVGGYQPPRGAKGPIMFLVRCHDFGGGHDFVVKVGPMGTVCLRGHGVDEVLPQSDWLSFSRREPGSLFRIGVGGKPWKKMTVAAMKRWVGRGVFRVSPPLRQ